MPLKPALFNREMAFELHRQSKTSTRRPVIPQPYTFTNGVFGEPQPIYDNVYNALDITGMEYQLSPQYEPGDYIYVREAFCKDAGRYLYRADYSEDAKFYINGREVRMDWKPSIHMPREAARTFLHVTSTKLERVQDITDAGAVSEGFGSRAEFAQLWDKLYSAPIPVRKDGRVVKCVSYPWSECADTREKSRMYKGVPWEVYGNPWVWVYEFEFVGEREARESAVDDRVHA